MRVFSRSLTLLLCASIASIWGATIGMAAEGGREASSAAVSNFGALPLNFEENRGQADSRVRFVSRGSGYSFFLTDSGAVLTFSRTGRPDAFLRMDLAGANSKAKIQGQDLLPGCASYFVGNDPQRWHAGIPTYSRVAYENIYPGINLVYYGNQQQLEYDFVVAPGVNADNIRLKVDGGSRLSVSADGDLVLRSDAGEVHLLAPRVYQQINGVAREIAGRWILRGKHSAGFGLGNYDRTRELVIDPVLMYSSFLGGSQQNVLNKIALDSQGNAYVAGYTASGDFPAAPTPQAMTFGGGSASRGAFVAKIDPTGSQLLYTTYLSGSIDEEATGLAVDQRGNVYLAGTTHSADFPTLNAFQSKCLTQTALGGCSAAFLTKISPEGNAIVFSTYLGGGGGESARGLALGSDGSAYVAGATSSVDFPVTPGAAQGKCGGACQQNAFVAKFNPSGAALDYATYVGGSGTDDAADLAIDALGNVYLTGKTTSPDFPLATAYQKSCPPDSATSGACLATAFVTKIKPDGSAFAYSTYLGGSLGSRAAAITVDAAGSAYVTGATESADFPVVNAFQKSCALDKSSGTCSTDAFVTKLATSGKSLVYSTYLGGSGRDEASGIAVDAGGNAHIVGSTESADLPMVSASQSKLNGQSDAFVARLNTAGSTLTFSTYHGGSATESGSALALDAKGNVYLTGQTASADFPTSHPFQSSCAGTCASAFVTKMAAPAPVASAPTITSAANTTFTVGTNGTFTVTTTGTPIPTITETGSLPNGVTFVDNGNNTATLSGTPGAGTGGTYPFTITAANGTTPNATQNFTLIVDQVPAITSAASTTFTVGNAGTFTVTTTGTPTAAITRTGSLPSGVGFVDNGDGTATLSGTPAAGTGGSYPITITANNGVTPNATQSFTLTVDQAPAITSAASTTFTVGSVGTFTVTATGTPAPTFSETGALPTGVNLTSAGVLSGTPAAGTAGTYPITITAANGVTPNATQSFRLQVNQGPVITSANNTTFTVGTAGSFTVTATGTPAPTLSETGSLPSGVSFNTSTGVLGGTPAAGTGGTYSITFTATSTAGTTNQIFTLTVDEAPSITSGAATTFIVSTAGSFTVTTGGFPKPAITRGGAALPSGVNFVDNGNGTATLSGTPAVGTGGSYALTFTANNGIGSNATQNFTLTVREAASITSTNSLACQVLVACTLTVTTTPTASPVPTLSESGSLPSGITFVDNGNGTATLGGTPAQGTGGSYSLTLHATNSAGTGSQAFTLTVADFSQSLSGAPVTIIQGSTGNATLTLTGQGGYSGTVTSSCASGTSCTFLSTPLTLNSSTTTSSTTVTISTSNATQVGSLSTMVTSTDGNGDTHNITLPYNVECTFALSSPTFTPLTSGAATPYPFAISLAETAGGSNCPWTASASSPPFTFLNGTVANSSVTVTGSDAFNASPTPVSFQLPANTQLTAAVNSIQFAFFGAAPATGTLKFTAVQEAIITPSAVIAGASSQVPLPTSSVWPSGSTVAYSTTCGVVGPNGALDATNNFGITCSVSGTTLTINTSTSTVAANRRGLRPASPVYLLALVMPAFVLMGSGLGDWRKRLARGKALRALGALTLILLFAILPGCGGGIKGTIGSVGNTNNFTITVLGTVTDSTGAVVGVEIQTISLAVTPQV